MKVWVLALGVMMLAACDSRHEMLTSSYGNEMLSGQVVVSGMPNGSPAGVEVSVRGTGMAMILAESGEFLFAGVPADAQLDFRRADGIEASMRVDAGSGFLAIELTKTTATASTKKSTSRRRGVSPTREVSYEFEGVILEATAASLTMFTSHQVEQTVALVPETIIRKGQTTLAAADLAKGMRVHVKSRKDGETYTAVQVIVQDESDDDGGTPAPPAVTEYEGTVRSASATTLVVFTSHREEKTFTVGADTVVRKGQTTVKPEDLQAGWTVHVKTAAAAGGTATALEVIVQNTKGKAD